MSAKAFVLIETELGKRREVVATLKEIEEVTTADRVTGPYDVIAVVERVRLNDIGKVVAEKIKPVPGVSRMVFCLVVGED